MLVGMLALVILEAWLTWDSIAESGKPRVLAVCLRFIVAAIFIGYSITMCCLVRIGFYLDVSYDHSTTPLFLKVIITAASVVYTLISIMIWRKFWRPMYLTLKRKNEGRIDVWGRRFQMSIYVSCTVVADGFLVCLASCFWHSLMPFEFANMIQLVLLLYWIRFTGVLALTGDKKKVAQVLKLGIGGSVILLILGSWIGIALLAGVACGVTWLAAASLTYFISKY